MNDRFRLKAFDKEKKIMYQAVFIDSYRIVCYEKFEDIEMYRNSFISGYQEYMLDDENLVLIQCTGLKDKNGRLIYEGDILEVKNRNDIKRIYEIKLGFLVHFPNVNTYSWSAKDIAKPVLSTALSNLKHQGLAEIIGNIYNNPELSEAK